MNELERSLDNCASELIRDVERDPQDLGSKRFVAQELRLAHHGFRRSLDRPDRDDRFEQLVYLRLIAEIALRLRWTTAEVDQDQGGVLQRLAALEKQDLMQLRASTRAIHQRVDNNEPELDGQLAQLIDSIAGDPAPRSLTELAVTEDAKGIYATHRMCSSVVHAGAALRRAEIMPAARARDMILGTMISTTAYAVMTLAALDGQWPSAWQASQARALMERYFESSR